MGTEKSNFAGNLLIIIYSGIFFFLLLLLFLQTKTFGFISIHVGQMPIQYMIHFSEYMHIILLKFSMQDLDS